MATYVVTGVSKGIGWEIMRQVSSDPKNTFIGLVRDKAATEKRVTEELGGRPNIHILRADLTSHDDLKQAAADTASLTGGSIDYLVSNAGWPSLFDAFVPIGALGEKPQEMEEVAMQLFKVNAIGNIHLYNLFLPLLLKGKVKKAINVASGTADLDWTNNLDIEVSSLYAMSKAAMNMVTAKFSAQYKKDGVLFVGICPGMVDCGHYQKATPEELKGVEGFMGKVVQYAPTFTGPRPPEPSVKELIEVWDRASIQRGDAGAFLSHYGNKKWV